MFINSSPLNWHSTLRRLKKDGEMGQLGRDLGILPGRKSFTSQLVGMATKRRPTQVITDAATPEQTHIKARKPNKAVAKDVKSASASDAAGETTVIQATETTAPSSPHPTTRLDFSEVEAKPSSAAKIEVRTPHELITEHNQQKEAKEEAAKKLQRAFRRKKEVRGEYEAGKAAMAAVKAQKFAQQNAAATNIQRVARGALAKNVVAKALASRRQPSVKSGSLTASPVSGATIRSATQALLTPKVTLPRTFHPSPEASPSVLNRTSRLSPDNSLDKMEGGVKLSTPRRKSSAKPARNARADVLNTVARLGKAGLKAFFGSPEKQPQPPVLPTQQTPKRSAKKPNRLLGGAAKPAATKPAYATKASPAKQPSAKKESMGEKIKRLAAERIAQNKAMEMDVVEEPPSPPKNNASLKTLKWPGTVAVARARGVSEEVIESMKGNARSLKLYLTAH